MPRRGIEFGCRMLPEHASSGLTIVEQADGQFGKVTIADLDGSRFLWCGTLCHGSSYLEPAAVIAGDRFVPGAVPEASYHVGWLLAVCAHPAGEVLMAGLGAGAGVTALLHEFPDLRLCVVEIDAEVIRLARRHFPLLGRYERDGRLSILHDDIARVVSSARSGGSPRWSIALLDAYRFSAKLYCPATLLSDLRQQADAIWLNLVDEERLMPQVRRSAAALVSAGWAVRTVMPILSSHHGTTYRSGNVLIGSSAIDEAAAQAYTPFSGIEHAHAQQARSIYLATWEHLRRRERERDRGAGITGGSLSDASPGGAEGVAGMLGEPAADELLPLWEP